jgi:signal transduction histidine kinase
MECVYLFFTSILIREFLLDTSPENDRKYVQQLITIRGRVQQHIQRLETMIYSQETPALGRLKTETDRYWATLLPVFKWAPEERAQRGTYFIRQEQRPRRQSIEEVADDIRRLNAAFYRQQFEGINASKESFRQDLMRVMLLAFLVGLAVAGASIWRIAQLERRAAHQQKQTERKEAELRELSARLMSAQEAERKAISRELHDDVGQKLTALRMELGSLERLRSGDETNFREHLGEAKELAEQSLRTIRDISSVLRPSVLDDLGLGAALQRHARLFSKRSGTAVAVHLEGELDQLPDRHRTYVFRMVQEMLTNVAKHSQAKSIAVHLRGESDILTLTVTDDGIGFEPEQVRGKGLGLIGIEERVRELGGSLRVEAEPGKGVRIEVTIGLAAAAGA